MEVLLEVPDDIVQRLQARSMDIPRQAMESLAAESYRSGILTSAEVQRMLGFETRWETDAFLKERRAYLHYTIDDFEKDIETLRGLSERDKHGEAGPDHDQS
jgi:predicted HTH domain antitoxin